MSGKNLKKPKIIISENDFSRLMGLAENAPEKSAIVADQLMAELDRARVVAPGKVPANVVQMGSSVEFQSSDGSKRQVTLVYPGEADIAEGKISIMTPIGAALIGLSPSQSIGFALRDNREQIITVLAVSKPGEKLPSLATDEI